ncbi:MAG TPA: hypothetical protein VNP98_08390 [Chthoniobacterales bacterium]|nr:hypothetical protein [Chthoniobacterales bacterium]
MNIRLQRKALERRTGAALVIVLAFVVLLAGVVAAYLARTSTERQLAHGSFNQIKADQLARSALGIVVGDLKQEIVNGSTSATVNHITLYTPTAAANVLPQRSGVPGGAPDPIPNLIRRSIQSDPIALPGVGSHASALSSAPLPSSSPGRTKKGEINVARWNKHYLIPRPAGIDPTDTSPIPAFAAPDWVFVSDQGPTILSSPARSVLGRYAYAIYDEGGLLDVNVAGYPPAPNTVPSQFGLKGFLSFADLAVAGLSSSAVSDLVGWRNYASAKPSGGFGSFLFNPTSAASYFNFVLSNLNGFLGTGSLVWNERTDQMFTSRQMLIEYRSSTGFSADALQYLGTFSRDSNFATWGPASTQRVTANFTRPDGSIARQGEPLFRRFVLPKLSWLGQNGPVPAARASDIRRDFGLVWNVDHWDYYGANGVSPADRIPAIDGTREPDFFQLLDFARQTVNPRPAMGEILALGASIIDQFDGGGGDGPTVIEYAGPPAPSPAPPNPRAYGRETAAPSPVPDPTPLVLDRALRNPGELGYAYKNATTTLDFHTLSNVDAPLLDLFTISPANRRAGVINLNTRNSVALAAMIAGTTRNEGSDAVVSTVDGRNAALDIVAVTNPASGLPALGRHELGRLTAAVRSNATGAGEEARELIGRSLAEATQTRTWNLMIDLIAQSGRYPSSATNLAQFVVEGEKRYWLHVAIDRLTGEVIDRQPETVYE